MFLKETLSWVATITAVAVALVGSELCVRIIRKGSPGDISFIPFLIMFINACLWLKYGILRDVTSIIIVNTISACLQFTYMSIYYRYSLQRNHLHKLLSLGVLFLFTPLVYIRFYVANEDRATNFLGIFCCVMTVVAYGAPLSSMMHILKTRSTECISFPLTLANFVVAVEWFSYGVLLDDSYVQLPNLFGGLLCLVQFGLFFKYPARSKISHVLSM